MSVKILGFEADKAKKLQHKITDQGGTAQVLLHNSDLNLLLSMEDRTSLILTNKEHLGTMKHYLNKIPYPIVDLEWMEDSFRSKLCKYPFDYALNQTYISHKEPVEHYPKMRKKLEIQLTSPVIDKLQTKILENTFIYLGTNVNAELAALLKKLVMVYGGFYLDELSPIVTHILTEPLTEQEYTELKVYGVLVNLVRV